MSLPNSNCSNIGDQVCELQQILDEAWTVLATNNVTELEKTIDNLKLICGDISLQYFSSDDLLAARRTCKRLRTLLNRRSRDLVVTSQLVNGFRGQSCQH